ncbi:TraR/DksA C4-type zinc finger protein [Methylococcus mesophilus]|uniref:TraR/DksA C4-type zinc finger protein n=1 Tax=Methylococcus mesophilus TaxID=2993564 RepID=UPI00224A90FA|nr:TraR/DksA C4-type zinc finger protein [Methylococcus mesophilus]UZR27443.1 TraR/DksA C4-type zinc finger protein [Methylococcus mesophilus]
MDAADIAEERIEQELDLNRRAALDMMKPDMPQIVVAGEDGAPTIICYDCEEPIPQGQLDAYPTAIRCMDCQVEHERYLAAEARR